jgi:hypothetical protein
LMNFELKEIKLKLDNLKWNTNKCYLIVLSEQI